MERKFLASLHCPYSGSPLSLSKVTRETGEQINYGIVSSEAGDFPIVEGILRLQVDEYREPIVEQVREKRFPSALAIVLDEAPFHGRGGAAISLASRLAFRAGFHGAGERLNSLKRNFLRAVTGSDASFANIAEKLSSDGAADWQISPSLDAHLSARVCTVASREGRLFHLGFRL